MNNLYSNDQEVVKERIKELGGDDDEEKEEKITYVQALCDPNYKTATYVGIALAVGQ